MTSKRSISTLSAKLSKAEADTNRIMQDFIRAGILHKAADTGMYDVSSRDKIKSFDPDILKETIELVLHKLCNLDSEVQLIKLLAANIQAEQDLQNRNDTSESLCDAEERFSLESKSMRRKIAALTDDNGKLEQQVYSLQNVITSLERENQNNSTVKAESQMQMDGLSKSIKKLQRQLDSATVDTTRERNLRTDLETSLNLAVDRSNELQQENENISHEVLQLKRDLVAAQQENDVLKGNANKKRLKRSQMDGLVQRLKERLARKESELNMATNERDVLMEKLTKAQEDYRNINGQLTGLQDNHRSRLARADRLDEENQKLQNTVDSTTRQLDEVVRQYEERLDLQKQCFDETDRIIDLKEKLRRETHQREELQARMESSTSELERLRRELTEKECRWEAQISMRDEKLKEMQVNLHSCLNEKQKSADERGLLINEVNNCVKKLTEEKDRLDNQLSEAKVEMDAIGYARSNMEMENARLRERLDQLEQQASSFSSWDTAFSELVESKKRLAYERGKLQTRVEQMQQELESVTDTQSQHAQLKRSFANLESKYSQTQSDLSQCRLQVQSLESQLRQRDENIQRKEKDFHLAIQSRDEAVKEAQRLLGHVEAVEERERKRVAAIQNSLDEAKSDNQRVRDSLESMMKSHGQLQHAIELLQTELGQKDASIQLLRDEKNELGEKQRKMVAEMNIMTQRLADFENLERTEVQPLRQSLHNVRNENSRLSHQIDSTQRELNESRGKIRSMEEDSDRREKKLEEHSRVREQMEQNHQIEVNGYEERLENLRLQLSKEREMNWKRCDKDNADLRRQLEESYRKNGELSRNVTSLRHQVSELEYQLRETSSKLSASQLTSSEVQRTKADLEDATVKCRKFREEKDRLEEEKKALQRKNRDLSQSLEMYVDQVASLQKEATIKREPSMLDLGSIPAYTGRSELTSRYGGEGDISPDGVSRLLTRDVSGEISRDVGSRDITNKAQELLQTSRQTIGRLSDYIISHSPNSHSLLESREKSGSQTHLNRTDPVMSAYRAERDFSRYIQQQINDIKSSSLRNLEELRSELMLEDMKSSS